MKILVDANIALDVLLKRHPFYITGTQILGLSKGGIDLFISATTITDIYYIVQKILKDQNATMCLLKNLLESVQIASVNDSEIRRAIVLGWDDFEDAVQYATGENIAVDYLVTRNTTDYNSVAFPVVTPDELLNIIT